MDIAGTRRGGGRPTKYQREVIRQDMAQLQITDDVTLDKSVWRRLVGMECYLDF